MPLSIRLSIDSHCNNCHSVYYNRSETVKPIFFGETLTPTVHQSFEASSNGLKVIKFEVQAYVWQLAIRHTLTD